MKSKYESLNLLRVDCQTNFLFFSFCCSFLHFFYPNIKRHLSPFMQENEVKWINDWGVVGRAKCKWQLKDVHWFEKILIETWENFQTFSYLNLRTNPSQTYHKLPAINELSLALKDKNFRTETKSIVQIFGFRKLIHYTPEEIYSSNKNRWKNAFTSNFSMKLMKEENFWFKRGKLKRFLRSLSSNYLAIKA